MKKKIFILLFVMIFAIMAIGCGSKEENGKTPEEKAAIEKEKARTFKDAAEHITYSSFKLLDAGAFDSTIKVGAKGDFSKLFADKMDPTMVPFLNEFLNNSKLNYNLKVIFNDPEQLLKFSFAYGLMFNEKPLMDLEVFSNDKNIGFNFPSMSKKGFVVSHDKLFSMINDKEGADAAKDVMSIDFNKYRDIVLDGKTYEELYTEKFAKYKELTDKFLNDTFTKTDITEIERDGKKVPVTEYKGEYDMQKAMALNKEMIAIAKDDEDLKSFVLDKGTKIFDEMISSKDYEKLQMTLEDIEEAKKDFTDAITNKWADMFNEISARYEEGMNADANKVLQESTVHVLYRISEANVMESSVVTFTVEGFEINAEYVLNNYGSAVAISSSNEFYNLNSLLTGSLEEVQNNVMTNQEFFDYTKGFVIELIDYVNEGESFAEVFKLMESNNLSQQAGMIKQGLAQVKMMLDSINSPEDLINMMGMGM